MENEKLQREQMLGAFWEHMPAIDQILIRDRMLFLQNEIRSLENRKRALLEEQQELIVRAVTLGDRSTGETRRNEKIVTVSPVYWFFQFQAYPLTYSSFENNVVSIMLFKLHKGFSGSLCSYKNEVFIL